MSDMNAAWERKMESVWVGIEIAFFNFFFVLGIFFMLFCKKKDLNLGKKFTLFKKNTILGTNYRI